MKPSDEELARKKEFKESLSKSQIKECLHPNKNECSGKVLRAHSIQNNGILRQISDNGDLLFAGIETGFIKDSLENIGRGVATTFYGFCTNHDSITFEPIEDKAYSQTDEQNFLFFYRALCKEILAKRESLNVFEEIKKRGGDTEGHIIGSKNSIKELNSLKDDLDIQLISKNHTKSKSKIRVINRFFPIAVCSCFSPEYKVDGTKLNDLGNLDVETSKLFYNIFPQGGKTYFIFSYHEKHKDLVEEFLNDFIDMPEIDFMNMLSKIVCDYSENFVINPCYWNSFSEFEQKLFIVQYREGLFPKGKNHLKRINFCRLFR